MPDSILLAKLAALPPPLGGDEHALKQWIHDCEQLAGQSLFARDATGSPIVLAAWLGMAVAPLMTPSNDQPLIVGWVQHDEPTWWNELDFFHKDEDNADRLFVPPAWAAAFAMVESGLLPKEQMGDLALVTGALRRHPQDALRVWRWMVQAPDLDNADLSWMVIAQTEVPSAIPLAATWNWWRMYARVTALMLEGSGLLGAEGRPLDPERIVRGIVDAVQQGQVAASLASDTPKPHEQLQVGVMAYLSAGRGFDVTAALAAWDAWRASVGARWTDEALRLVGSTEQLFRLRYDRSERMDRLASIADRLFDNESATREWLLGYRGWRRFKHWRQIRKAFWDTDETIQMGLLLADDFPGWPQSHVDLTVEQEKGLPFLVDVEQPTRRLAPELADRLWTRRPGSSHRPLPAWIWVMCWALGRRGTLPEAWLDLDAEPLWVRMWESAQLATVLQQLPEADTLLQTPAPRSDAVRGLPAQMERHGLQVQRLAPTDPLTLVLGIFSDCCQHVFYEAAYVAQVAESPDGAYLVVRDGDAIIAQGILYTAHTAMVEPGRVLWLDTLETPKDCRRSPRLMSDVESVVWAYLGKGCAALELRGIAPCTPIVGRLHEAPSPLPMWTVPFITSGDSSSVRLAAEELAFVDGPILETTTGYSDPGAFLFMPDARLWLLSRTPDGRYIDIEAVVAVMEASTPEYWREFSHRLPTHPQVSVAVALAVGAAWAARFGFLCPWETAFDLAREAEHPGFRAAIQQQGMLADEKGQRWQEETYPWRDMLDTLVLAAHATVPAKLDQWAGAWVLQAPTEPGMVLWVWSSSNDVPSDLEWYTPLTDGPLRYKIAIARLG